MSKLGQRLKNTVRFLVVIFGALLMSVGIIYAATTIGTNISTTGDTTLGDTNADTITINGQIANATTTGNLVVGIATLATPTSTVSVYGTLHVFRGTATSSDALWVGSAGTVNTLDLQGGDLYVKDGAEIDGNITIGGFASTTGDLIINGGTISNTTSTATSTIGIFSDAHQNSTSTVSIGRRANDQGDLVTGCIEMVTAAGTYARAVLDGTTWNIKAGRCND